MHWVDLTIMAVYIVAMVLIGVLSRGEEKSDDYFVASGRLNSLFQTIIVGVIVILLLLATVGLCLFVYYLHSPDPDLPRQVDQIFPYFVATRLPVGIAGLLLAALLAATSIPSGINTLAAVLTLDFHARIHRNMTDAQRLRWGKIYTLLLGLAATLTAGMLSRLKTIFDLSQVILGIFAGPLLACIIVAVARWRCPGWAMIAGMLAGWLVGVMVSWTDVAVLWISPIATVVTMLVSCLLARIQGGGPGRWRPADRQHESIVDDAVEEPDGIATRTEGA